MKISRQCRSAIQLKMLKNEICHKMSTFFALKILYLKLRKTIFQMWIFVILPPKSSFLVDALEISGKEAYL